MNRRKFISWASAFAVFPWAKKAESKEKPGISYVEERIGEITVCGKKFLCREGFSTNYLHKFGDGVGFPVAPYYYERVLDDERAYLVDDLGIVWILGIYDKGIFDSPCSRDCFFYVAKHDPYMKDKLFNRRNYMERFTFS